MTEEIYRDIAGYEGFYQITSLGRVWSIPRLNHYGRRIKGRFLRPSPADTGHLHLTVSRFGKMRTLKIHRLVCEAFNGPQPSPDHEVAHWDGKPGNNVPNNLRWATRKQNMDDKIRHGTQLRGEECPQSKLNAKQVLEIRQRLSAGERPIDLAPLYGVTRGTISNIGTGHKWKHVARAA